MKSRTRRKIFWSAVAFVLAVVLAIVIVPPFINLDHLAPKIESAVLRQTGIEIKIAGPVRLSLLGRATISARDVTSSSYKGSIGSISFYIPYRSLLDINSAVPTSTIILNYADFEITSLTPPSGVRGSVILYDSSITFLGKRYDHINGVFKNGMFNGTLRTSDHKYTIQSDGDTFMVTNPNVNLNLTGQLFMDERHNLTAVGSISLDTNDANKWFSFDIPKIKGRVKFQSDFEWSGDRFRFYNISGEALSGDFSGSIEFGNGNKKINIIASGIEYDFTPLLQSAEFIENSEINFSGNGKFKLRVPSLAPGFPASDPRLPVLEFSRIQMSASARGGKIDIKSFKAIGKNAGIAANGEIENGTARNLDLTLYRTKEGETVRCILSGVDGDWSCARFDFASSKFSASGKAKITKDSFDLEFDSTNYDIKNIDSLLAQASDMVSRKNGNIRFRLAGGTHGIATKSGRDIKIEYFGHKGATLHDINGKNEILKILPDSLLRARGTVVAANIENGILTNASFTREAGTNQWAFEFDRAGKFRIAADAIFLLGAFYPNIDTGFLRKDMDTEISGQYKSGLITNLRLILIGSNATKLVGKFDGRAFDLHSDMLDLDELANDDYINNYESKQFVTTEPLTIPFALGANVSLSADKIKFGGEIYENFNYSLKPGIQKMSVTDAARGSLLFSIERKAAKYLIVAQFNKFEILGLVLPRKSPLNVADTTLTAQAELETFGITAHDFWANMAGDLDMTFTGGFLVGFDFDRFYAGAKTITKFNAEYAISDTLNGGDSVLKSLHLTGFYDGGNFITTSNLTALARHTEISGTMQLVNGKMSADLNVLLRGTAPVTRPISIKLLANGERDYSLFDIMQTLDPDYMREFIRIHDRF